MTLLRVLSVTSEIYPLIKTGGLADVAGALPAALADCGIAVKTLVPGYPAILAAMPAAETLLEHGSFFGGPARLLSGTHQGLELLVLDAPHLFARPGNPYLGPDGKDWPDNAVRFAALSRMAADIGLGAIAPLVPDIVHAHDWQAALAPVFLHYHWGPRPGTVMTVHNLAYQGLFPYETLAAVGLPPASFTVHGLEYYGQVGYLKGGLQFADRITTVSPTYALEIQTEDGGMGLAGLLRERSAVLSGILNGIDTSVWNPAADPDIAMRYSSDALSQRAANKVALQRRFGLDSKPDAPLLGVISRLSPQKGLDLLLANLDKVLSDGMQLALLGSGDRDIQDGYLAAARLHPGRIGVVIGYDEALAHLIQAGSDMLVVPSRFEPCGLTQLCALRYGAVPIVAGVGGLADTVVDAGQIDAGQIEDGATGFKFAPVTADGLAGALRRAVAAFHDKVAWHRLQRNGMATDVSWRNRATRYAELYHDILATRRIATHHVATS
ncbi:MAG TPA: glycogen synthase GlgA [Bradyrhizobium sp.]|nr:glycogen synthase GlgA [Bradyrhizobium sp.]